MARVFIDGFESGKTDLWDLVVGAWIVSGIAGMDGTYCLSCDAFGDYYAHKYVPAAPEYYLAFRYRGSSASYASSMCYFFNGATQLARLRRNPTTGLLEVRRGTGSGTLLATGTIAVNVGTPILIEVHYKPHDTAGVFQVRVGGVLDINFSGDTTDGATAIDGIRIGGDGTYYASCWFDNVVIDNAAWPGDTRIQAIRPSAPGALTEWDPSAGAELGLRRMKSHTPTRITSPPMSPARPTSTRSPTWLAPSTPSSVSRWRPGPSRKARPRPRICNWPAAAAAPITSVRTCRCPRSIPSP